MIDETPPDTWQELQVRVARILEECGVETEVEKTIPLARGHAEIDVWAHDEDATPAQTYLIECKNWSNPIPQEKVHAFRSVVGDSGAQWGAFVSRSGFQRGADEAAKYTNVRLMTWEQFQNLFADRWWKQHFLTRAYEVADPLVEYTEPINSRISRKAEELGVEVEGRFRDLREKHFALGTYCSLLCASKIGAVETLLEAKGLARRPVSSPSLPLDLPEFREAGLPQAILEATSLRGLLDTLIHHVNAALAEFDDVFGERA